MQNILNRLKIVFYIGFSKKLLKIIEITVTDLSVDMMHTSVTVKSHKCLRKIKLKPICLLIFNILLIPQKAQRNCTTNDFY